MLGPSIPSGSGYIPSKSGYIPSWLKTLNSFPFPSRRCLNLFPWVLVLHDHAPAWLSKGIPTVPCPVC